MSAEKIQQYEARAPRYVLNYQDNTVVRFSSYKKGSKKFQTRIVNLSETGMAFLLPALDNPHEDEIIKVEFFVPNRSAVACFAKVIRLENHQTFNKFGERQQFKLVAVRFEDLPVAQRQMIREGLLEEFEKMSRKYTKEQFVLKLQWLALQSAKGARTAMDWPIQKILTILKKRN